MGPVIEGLYDRNGHRRKVVGEVKTVSWRGALTKGKGRECKITKNMFLHINMLKWFLNKKHNIADFFLDTTVFTIRKLAL